MKSIFRRLMVSGLIATLLVCPAFAAAFPDVDEYAEYAEAVDFLRDIGLIVGDERGNFNPDNAVTRAEIATIVCRILGETDSLTVSTKFTDVSTTHWANGYITRAAELGLVNGYGDGNFGPKDSVTYEQAITLIVRAAGLDEVAVAAGGYPYGYVRIAEEAGYLENIPEAFGEGMCRWQVAVLCYNIMMGGNG